MDLTIFNDYLVFVIVGICCGVGFIIKTSFPKVDNKYIPLILAVLGIILNFWIAISASKPITPDVVFAGMFSGLSSTGLHQAFKNLIFKDKNLNEQEGLND